MQRRIIRSTERRQYSLLVEYHELPSVFLRSLECILELFSAHFRLALHLGKAVAFAFRLRAPRVTAAACCVKFCLYLMYGPIH